MPNSTVPRSVRLRTRTESHEGEHETDRQLLERFTSSHDQGAFAALVKRHGPMVLGVCRRVLGDAHEAEDAFQAAFLVLVRKSGCIAKPELLGNWLYGVAHRTALKAKVRAARRRTMARQVDAMTSEQPDSEVAQRELHCVLDEELSRLPRKYRAPLVLCYLQGKTHVEAARQLGWPSGSMSRRLLKASAVLRERLRSRGVVLPLSLLVLLLSRSSASANVTTTLLRSTVQAGAAFASQQAPLADIVSSPVAELTKEVLASIFAGRGRFLMLLLLPLMIGVVLAVKSGNVLASSSSIDSDQTYWVAARRPVPKLTPQQLLKHFPDGIEPCQ